MKDPTLSAEVTAKINALLAIRDELADKQYLKWENELLGTYKRSLLTIKDQIRAMYEKYGDSVTLSEMQSFNRLKNLELQITKEINTLNTNITIKTRKQLGNFFESNYYQTGFAIESGLGMDLSFGLLNPSVIQAAVVNPYDWEGRLKLWNNKLLLDIKQNVTDGLTQGNGLVKTTGNGLVKTTKNIQTSFETNLGKKASDKITRSNILRVVRTESTRAQELGNVSGFSQAESDARDLGFETLKIWDATLDSRTRPNHGAMDGKAADKDGMFHFTTMKGEKILVEAPHLTGTTDDINCFPEYVNAFSITPIKKAYKRFYEGELVEITTGSGIKLTGSPKHPILTPEGWVGIGSLNNGDNVLKCTLNKNIVSCNPDINNVPSKISEIFNLSRIAFLSKRVPGVSNQFHGDGLSNSNVDIVLIKSHLWGNIKPLILKPVKNILLSLTGHNKISLFRFSRKTHFLNSSNPSSGSNVGGFNLIKPFLFRHVFPFKNFAFGLITPNNIIFDENPSYNSTANIKSFSDLIFRNTRDIILNNFSRIKNLKFTYVILKSKFGAFLRSSLFNTIVSHNSIDSTGVNIENFCKVFPVSAGIIKTDKVVNVRKFYFSGHLYNLETVNNYYLASNIQNNNDNNNFLIAHNCRCGSRIEIKGLEPSVRRDNENKIVIKYKTYDEWVKGLK